MSTELTQIVEAEQAWVSRISTDIPAMAIAVGEYVADQLEATIRKEAETGFMPDIAADLQRILEMDASRAFEEGIDRQLLEEIRRRSERLQDLLHEDWILNSDRQALDSLRKSVRLLPQLKPHLDRVFRKAKPMVVTQLFRAIAHDVEDMEREWMADGQALCDAFERERGALEATITKMAESLLQQLRLEYRHALDAATSGTAPTGIGIAVGAH